MQVKCLYRGPARGVESLGRYTRSCICALQL